MDRTMKEEFVMEHILELCKERGWTKYRLSKETGIPSSTINNLIKRTNTPTIATLIKICNGFGITMAQFFSDGKQVSLTTEQGVLIQCWNRMELEEKYRTAAFISGILGNRGDSICMEDKIERKTVK
ncbi:helix-turn-helix protein [Clostridiales bacterium CHKCI001]|nr:helix-turn-helix protein [Clostridiales bacterium CHKCI001]